MEQLYTATEVDQTIRELADTIRNMDRLIFEMSQCTSWNQMRPIFGKLQVEAMSRQRAESDRINEILREELLKIYTKSEEQKLISRFEK